MSFIKSRKKIVSTAIASSLSVIATSAIAQDEIAKLPTIKAQATAEQSLKVDQSANTKFVAPLLDTPKSVSVISKKLIEDTQVTTLADALRTVPGITLGAGEGGNPNGDRPFIRGYNSESSMYVDGVRNSTSQNREMFAVEQVEVTKGSASAMGGAGTSGGSINMISKVAKKGDFLEGSVAGGTDNYQRITLDGNKDFGNGIAARVAVMGHHNEKAGQDDGAEYKRAGIAPSITFGLDTPTRATLSYYYLKSDDTPDSGVPYNYDVSKKATVGKPVDVKQGIYYGWLDRDFQKQENQSGTLKLEHDLTENLTLSNTAVYSKSKNNYLWTQPDDSQGNIVNGKVWRRVNTNLTSTDSFTDQLALTGKLNTGAFKHKFNIGAEYSKQDSDRGTNIVTDPNTSKIGGSSSNNNANNACSLTNSNGWCTDLNNPNSHDAWLGKVTANPNVTNITSKTQSVYALDNIEITPQWLLDLGVRWDKFETDMKYNQDSGSGATAIKAGTHYTSDNDFFNYQLGVTFKPAENGSIYLSYATSANPVGVDAGDGSEGISVPGRNTTDEQSRAINNLKPEEVKTYEIGTKWDLFGDKLNLTAAIFRTEKENTRALDTDGFTRNIGETRVDGIELGANGNITNKWAISAGYTYLDSEIVDAGFTKNTDGTYSPSSTNGNQVQNVAKNSATLWTTYQVLPQLNLGVGAIAMDKVYGDAANTKFVPGYVRYDAMARYNVNKNVDLQLNLNNLSDKRYFTKAYASHYATEAEGRNAVLSINFKY
ncbi:TonB-dependent siderophore receptor [Acinetobacter bereziniae]|uniref:TonB-dependent receptor n=1 Tax=Acinetobacter TaxID=469 RepID=UPI000EF67B05|nr:MULTISPECIES: TonB-dependent siderophore receptor [Acinetobacter]MBJ8421767.1 TonB-dependent siderophore receptor [Acinetobacter bereziniae]MCU4475006.1 TonB-dependent siderophore receptor [Acinetobacter bereziniae]MCU4542887.1 TonB-dependent siderophore receptor [Acinetobacter bereziniae]MCU4626655.1 TonB-dependent siderophore receptor [Acinetobacter bereziniae]BCX72470.1 catecholate siderophore receptor [Acinetobacter sp. Tol 5]